MKEKLRKNVPFTKKVLIILLLGAIASPFLLLILFWTKLSYSSRRYNFIEIMNLTQQVYLLENNTFANNLSELPLVFDNLDRDKILIQTSDNVAFNYAIPANNYIMNKFFFFSWEDKDKPLYSYVGGVAKLNNGDFISILCRNKIIGNHKPNPPRIEANQFVCGNNTKLHKSRD